MKFTHKKWYFVQEKDIVWVFRCLENISAIGIGKTKQKELGEEDRFMEKESRKRLRKVSCRI
jgi:hypothetical protein